MIELFERYGGDPKKTDALLKKYGFQRKDLKDMYTHAYGGGSQSEDQTTVEEYIAELANVAKLVNELAKLTPEQYAQRSTDERQYDTIFYDAYQQYLQAGISAETMRANPDIAKVDLARSKRLHDEASSK